ncbi:MAG: DUF1385 domain-containing protein [Actinomycetota bacterium]|nr:DUF1385 domain-containing protein [Actinomycetota bacterium]
MEGVMLRGKDHWVVAVRRPDGEIVSQTKPISPWSKNMLILKKPILRGALALVEAISLGVGALSFSAQESTDEDIEIGAKEMTLTVIIGFGLALGLFFALPVWLIRLSHGLLDPIIPGGGWGKTVALNLAEGAVRLAIFFGYLVLVSRIKDIKRVFEYHGAEHKTIHAFEHGVEMEPERIDAFSTQHVRCGTSFLLVVMVVAILVFSLLGRPDSILVRIALRFMVLPLVAGISYEVIKYAGRHEESRFVKIIMSPGLALQRLTTRPPSLDQIEVALVSLNTLLAVEAESARPPENGKLKVEK